MSPQPHPHPHPQELHNMSTLSSIINVLQGAGLTGTNLTSALSTLVANSPTTAIKAACSVILSNSSSPTVIKDEATKMAEIPNLPISVANLLPSLVAATTPVEVVQIVTEIESAVNATTGTVGGFLGF